MQPYTPAKIRLPNLVFLDKVPEVSELLLDGLPHLARLDIRRGHLYNAGVPMLLGDPDVTANLCCNFAYL